MITGMLSNLNNVAGFLRQSKSFWRSEEHVACFHMLQQTAKLHFEKFELIRTLPEEIFSQKS